MKKNFKPEPSQLAEQRATTTNQKNVYEAQKTQKEFEKISIGTFTLFGAKDEDTRQTFTVAFTREVNKSLLYLELNKRFGKYWSPKGLFQKWKETDTTKSELLHLSKPLPLKEIRKAVREAYKNALKNGEQT